MNAIIALAAKDLRLLVRDKFALFWILAFPLMFALFFGAIFSSGNSGSRGGISLALVDEDQSDISRSLIAQLADNESLRLTRAPVAEGQGDAEQTDAEQADPKLGAPTTVALEVAREAVQKGRKAAYLRIPSGYGENPYALFSSGDDDTPQLEIGIDPGRSAEAGFLQGILMGATFGSLQDRFLNKSLVREDLSSVRAEVSNASDLDLKQKLVLQTFLGALDLFVEQVDLDTLTGPGGAGGEASESGSGVLEAPFEIVDVTRNRDDEPRSSFDVTFPQALVWGLMSVAMGFAITLVRERSAGTLLRLRMAPIGRAQLLGSKALACFVGCFATMAVILAFGGLALGVRFDSFPLLALAMAATSVCFTGVMMTIAVLGKTETAVAGSAWGLMMPFAMIGGGMIPLMAMPDWLVKASVISPFKWAITAVEGAVWRGFTLTDMLLPCAVLVLMGFVFGAIGITIFRKIDA